MLKVANQCKNQYQPHHTKTGGMKIYFVETLNLGGSCKKKCHTWFGISADAKKKIKNIAGEKKSSRKF